MNSKGWQLQWASLEISLSSLSYDIPVHELPYAGQNRLGNLLKVVMRLFLPEVRWINGLLVDWCIGLCP